MKKIFFIVICFTSLFAVDKDFTTSENDNLLDKKSSIVSEKSFMKSLGPKWLHEINVDFGIVYFAPSDIAIYSEYTDYTGTNNIDVKNQTTAYETKGTPYIWVDINHGNKFFLPNIRFEVTPFIDSYNYNQTHDYFELQQYNLTFYYQLKYKYFYGSVGYNLQYLNSDLVDTDQANFLSNTADIDFDFFSHMLFLGVGAEYKKFAIDVSVKLELWDNNKFIDTVATLKYRATDYFSIVFGYRYNIIETSNLEGHENNVLNTDPNLSAFINTAYSGILIGGEFNWR